MLRHSCLSATLAALLATALPLTSPCAQAADGKVEIHRYTSTDRSWHTNAFWLESDTGVVVIDTLATRSDAKAMAAAIRSTGKPLVAILLTHPHGDHFGGIPTLRSELGPVPVYASQATADAVQPVFQRMLKSGQNRRFGADAPTEAMTPDHIVASGETLELAGMHFTLQDLGAMEAKDNVVIQNKETGALFSGDATVFAADFYVGEGRSCQSLAALQRLRGMYDAGTMTYSGHYAPMRLSVLLDDNIAQVRFLRETMLAAFAVPENRAADGSLTDATRERLVKQVAERLADHADYGLTQEVMANDVNLPGLEMEIQKELASGKTCAAK